MIQSIKESDFVKALVEEVDDTIQVQIVDKETKKELDLDLDGKTDVLVGHGDKEILNPDAEKMSIVDDEEKVSEDLEEKEDLYEFDQVGNYVESREQFMDLPIWKCVAVDLTKLIEDYSNEVGGDKEDAEIVSIISPDEIVKLAIENDTLKDQIRYTYYESQVDGSYIGDSRYSEDLLKLLKEHGITYMESFGSGSVANIGYSPKENKWYGWSHRAFYGFGLGDVVQEGDITSIPALEDSYAVQHPEMCYNLPVGFTAFTLNDAKRMAMAFADYVG